jgi:pimeloyl-ACP methyl ester carboxylesterase
VAGGAGVSTFVLVHGAWHGAWCWQRVVPLLQDAGHRVTTPTLTGLGERRHLASGAVNLDTHVEDVLNHLAFEGLDDVVLVAHSYAGFVAHGVADRNAGAIRRLILLDAFIPRDGETMAEHVGERGDQYRAAASEDPDWLAPAPPISVLGVGGEAAAWAEPRLTAQPVHTYLQPLAVGGGIDRIADKLYISCTSPALATLVESRRRIAEAGWPTVEIACGHDAMIAAPADLASILLA